MEASGPQGKLYPQLMIFFVSVVNNVIKFMSITEFEMIKSIRVPVTGHDTYI